MKRLIARFAHWLLSLVETPPIAVSQVIYTPADCTRCSQPWTSHACPHLTVDQDVAICVVCAEPLPKGAIRQHTGAWICLPCKGKVATGLP